MKRRSFLAMLGLAPVAGVAAAESAPAATDMEIQLETDWISDEMRKVIGEARTTVRDVVSKNEMTWLKTEPPVGFLSDQHSVEVEPTIGERVQQSA